jgi:hypothetical protein
MWGKNLGASPQTPEVLRFGDKNMMEGSAMHDRTAHVSVTNYGARVAPQHCPILRVGRW